MVEVRESKGRLRIANPFLQVHLLEQSRGVDMEVAVRRGRCWRRLLSSSRGSLVEVAADRGRRAIRHHIEERKEGRDRVEVLLSGRDGKHEVKTRIVVRAECKHVQLAHAYTVKGSTMLEYVRSPYRFLPGVSLDYCWLPHLLPRREDVVGDHSFRSPSIILQRGGCTAALVPDLELLREQRKMKTCFDFSLQGKDAHLPVFSFGFMDYAGRGHLYYAHRRSMTKKLCNETLKYGYFLLLEGGAERRRGYQEVVRFLWTQYGHKNFQDAKFPAVSFDTYARYGYRYLERNRWMIRTFRLRKKNCGGIYAMTFTAKRELKPMRRRELAFFQRYEKAIIALHKAGALVMSRSMVLDKLLEKIIYHGVSRFVPQILNQVWFNNIRTAYGIYFYGKKWKRAFLLALAEKMKNLALSAPLSHGVFPSVCFCPKEGIFWRKGTKAFEHVNAYHLPDNSTTCYWMLQWYRDMEQDEALLRFCQMYADFLLRVQLPSGAIPTWVDVERSGEIAIKDELRESASTGCSTMFLAELYLLTKEKKVLRAAEKGARFLRREVLPEQKWWDFETFFSCSPKRIGRRDPRTGIYPQNTLSIYWASETFKSLYKITKKRTFLDYGLQCVDALCLYQQVWDPPYLSIYPFGGFGVMNTDGEWHDARQALFALTLLAYAQMTGNSEYRERGVAALRASFLLMLAPENRKVASGNMRKPLRAEDYGIIYENYGHLGYDRGVPGYVEFDWGVGTACTAAAMVEGRYRE